MLRVMIGVCLACVAGCGDVSVPVRDAGPAKSDQAAVASDKVQRSAVPLSFVQGRDWTFETDLTDPRQLRDVVLTDCGLLFCVPQRPEVQYLNSYTSLRVEPVSKQTHLRITARSRKYLTAVAMQRGASLCLDDLRHCTDQTCTTANRPVQSPPLCFRVINERLVSDITGPAAVRDRFTLRLAQVNAAGQILRLSRGRK